MRKAFAWCSVLALVAALAVAPATLAKKPKYPIPKPSGGISCTKSADKAIGKKLQKTTGKKLAKGFSVTVKCPKKGTVSATISHGSTQIGSGSVSVKAHKKATLHISFTSSGKTWLKKHAGKKVTASVTFKPKSGSSETSTVTVKLG